MTLAHPQHQRLCPFNRQQTLKKKKSTLFAGAEECASPITAVFPPAAVQCLSCSQQNGPIRSDTVLFVVLVYLITGRYRLLPRLRTACALSFNLFGFFFYLIVVFLALY